LKKHGVKNRWIVFVTPLNLKMGEFKDYFDVEVREILKKPIGPESLEIVKRYLRSVRPTNYHYDNQSVMISS
jgi:hypothetical protein